jgi:hypothetical protein
MVPSPKHAIAVPPPPLAINLISVLANSALRQYPWQKWSP